MKDLELEGCNGTIRKLRGFKERIKEKMENYRGLKCNFCKLEYQKTAMADQPPC